MRKEEIAKRIEDEKNELRQLHFQHAIADIPNPMLIREKRRLIARLNTIMLQMPADTES